ncbi:MAG: hypothetical protein WC269_02285 [Candidatus Gracilibacteria bacterium]|jgi:hypothetical protein
MFKKDDDIIDLRRANKKHEDFERAEDEPEFKIHRVEGDEPDFMKSEVTAPERPKHLVAEHGPGPEGPYHEGPLGAGPVAPHHRPDSAPVSGEIKTIEKVKIRLEKFLNMIVKVDNDEFYQKHAEEEIYVSTEFLTELASLSEGKKGAKIFFMFLFGITLGVIITILIVKY